jgi:putative thioredoxin
MFEITDIKEFEREVIRESDHLPVLVDFYADWCQPCKILGPLLEELSKEFAGKFKLVKVNTEKCRQLAMQFQITGIPAVKLFVQGKIKAEFNGALPKHLLKEWLMKNLPKESEKELENIREEIRQNGGNLDKKVIKKLEKLIEKTPDLNEAKIILASHYVFNEAEKAKNLLAEIYEDSPDYLMAKAIRTFVDFIRMQENDMEEDPSKQNLKEAIEAARNKDFETAIQALIQILWLNKSYMDEIARRAGVAIFTLLGKEHDITKKLRRRFDMSLY